MGMEEAKDGWLWRMLALTEEASKEVDQWLKAHPEASVFGVERIERLRKLPTRYPIQ
jgi:hypothetical protein